MRFGLGTAHADRRQISFFPKLLDFFGRGAEGVGLLLLGERKLNLNVRSQLPHCSGFRGSRAD